MNCLFFIGGPASHRSTAGREREREKAKESGREGEREREDSGERHVLLGPVSSDRHLSAALSGDGPSVNNRCSSCTSYVLTCL